MANRTLIIGVAAAAALCAPTRAPAMVSEEVLSPAGGWQVDYGEAQCMAVRGFRGTDGDIAVLSLRPAFEGQTYEVLFSEKGNAPAMAEEKPGKIDIGQGLMPVQMLRYRSKGERIAVRRLRLDETATGQLAKSDSIAIQGFSRSVRLKTGEIGPVMTALATCLADLKTHWNHGVEAPSLARKATPKGDLQALFDSTDYPQEALSRLKEGTARYYLLVDEQGSVAGCDVVKPSGVLVLDFMGCQVMSQRAKFALALDSNGKAMRTTVMTPPVTWRIAN